MLITCKVLKQYISSYKACKISNSCCSIDGKFGSLTLDLSSLHNLKKCNLNFRRVSGNGLIHINDVNYTITSKVSIPIEVDISNSKIINIIRPYSSIGILELLNLDVELEEVEELEELEEVGLDVVSLLKKYETYCISSVDSKVFASEGAYIVGSDIASLETMPENMYKIQDGKVIFLGPCEINNIALFNNIVHIKKQTIPNNIKPTQVKKHSIKTNTDVSVENTSKQFSVIYNDNFYVESTFNDITGVIEPLNFSANLWVNKFQNIFPNIKVKSSILNNKNIKDKSDLILTDLDNLRFCNKIWLEEFVNKPITKNHIDILSKARVVISSSLPNVQFLRSEYNINMLYMPKFWPYINFNKNNDNYVLYLNRDSNITKEFVSRYRRKNNKLVIVGVRGNFPNHIDIYNEYLSYEKLFDLIINASAIIDLSKCTHYMSAALDLAFISGIPIITSNQWMGISKPKVHLVNTYLKNGEIKINFNDVFDGLKSVKKPNDTYINETYNLNLYGCLKSVMDY